MDAAKLVLLQIRRELVDLTDNRCRFQLSQRIRFLCFFFCVSHPRPVSASRCWRDMCVLVPTSHDARLAARPGWASCHRSTTRCASFRGAFLLSSCPDMIVNMRAWRSRASIAVCMWTHLWGAINSAGHKVGGGGTPVSAFGFALLYFVCCSVWLNCASSWG